MSNSATPGRRKRVHAARKPTRTPRSTLADRVKQRRRGTSSDQTCKTLNFNTPLKPRKSRIVETSSDEETDDENSPPSSHGGNVRQKTERKMALGSDDLSSLVMDVGRLSIAKDRRKSQNERRTPTGPKTISLAPPNNKGRKKVFRITRSKKIFQSHHELEGPLGNQENYGGGCLVYRSRWQAFPTVTKLMPLFAENGFDAEENIENAHRETDIHTSAYRLALKRCHVDECPVVPIWAVTETEYQSKIYLALVMPRFDCNLAEFIHRNGPVKADVAWRLLRAGVDFLRICMESQFIHHDIKPENILLTTNGRSGPIKDICFGDFGCGAWKDEEFPFNPITGTVTMWDMESLGLSYGDEDGFCLENDVFGMLGCVFDAIIGYSLLEDKLDDVDPDWESLEWEDYTNLVRNWRPRIITEEVINNELDRSFCSQDTDLRNLMSQLSIARQDRLDMEQVAGIIEDHLV